MSNELKNVVVRIPYDEYIKLKYIADKMKMSLPQLMTQIINQSYFKEAVSEMFAAISKLE